MDSVSSVGQTVDRILVSGEIIKCTDKENLCGVTEQFTKEIMLIIKNA